MEDINKGQPQKVEILTYLPKSNIFLKTFFQLKHRVSLPITVSSTTDDGVLRPTAHQTAQQKPGADLKHFAPA